MGEESIKMSCLFCKKKRRTSFLFSKEERFERNMRIDWDKVIVIRHESRQKNLCRDGKYKKI